MLHRYETTKEKDGTIIIHDVPIFAEISRDMELGEGGIQTFNYDEDWINTAVKEARRREIEQHHKPALFIEHNRDGKPMREIAGFIVNQRAHTIQYDGKPTRTVYADLVITLPEVFEEIRKGQFPGISVEIKDSQENNPQTFTAAALLNTEPAALKFDPLLVKDPKEEYERPKSFMEARKTGASYEIICFSESAPMLKDVEKFAQKPKSHKEIQKENQLKNVELPKDRKRLFQIYKNLIDLIPQTKKFIENERKLLRRQNILGNALEKENLDRKTSDSFLKEIDSINTQLDQNNNILSEISVDKLLDELSSIHSKYHKSFFPPVRGLVDSRRSNDGTLVYIMPLDDNDEAIKNSVFDGIPEVNSTQSKEAQSELLQDQLDKLEKEAYVALDQNDDEETFYAKLKEANDLLKEAGYGQIQENDLDEEKHKDWREYAFGEVQKFAEEKVLDSEIGMSREEMPQIKEKDFSQFLDSLKDEGIKITEGEISASLLKPTQEELDLEKVKAIKKSGKKQKPVLVSSDLFILDGHHRWKSKEGETIGIVQIDMPIKELLEKSNEFLSNDFDESSKTSDLKKAQLATQLEWAQSHFNNLESDLFKNRHERRYVKEKIIDDMIVAFNKGNSLRKQLGLKEIPRSDIFRDTKRGLEVYDMGGNRLLDGLDELNIPRLPSEEDVEIEESKQEKKDLKQQIESAIQGKKESVPIGLVTLDQESNKWLTPKGLPKLVNVNGKPKIYIEKENQWLDENGHGTSASGLAQKLADGSAVMLGDEYIPIKETVAFAEVDELINDIDDVLEFAEVPDLDYWKNEAEESRSEINEYIKEYHSGNKDVIFKLEDSLKRYEKSFEKLATLQAQGNLPSINKSKDLRLFILDQERHEELKNKLINEFDKVEKEIRSIVFEGQVTAEQEANFNNAIEELDSLRENINDSDYRASEKNIWLLSSMLHGLSPFVLNGVHFPDPSNKGNYFIDDILESLSKKNRLCMVDSLQNRIPLSFKSFSETPSETQSFAEKKEVTEEELLAQIAQLDAKAENTTDKREMNKLYAKSVALDTQLRELRESKSEEFGEYNQLLSDIESVITQEQGNTMNFDDAYRSYEKPSIISKMKKSLFPDKLPNQDKIEYYLFEGGDDNNKKAQELIWDAKVGKEPWVKLFPWAKDVIIGAFKRRDFAEKLPLQKSTILDDLAQKLIDNKGLFRDAVQEINPVKHKSFYRIANKLNDWLQDGTVSAEYLASWLQPLPEYISQIGRMIGFAEGSPLFSGQTQHDIAILDNAIRNDKEEESIGALAILLRKKIPEYAIKKSVPKYMHKKIEKLMPLAIKHNEEFEDEFSPEGKVKFSEDDYAEIEMNNLYKSKLQEKLSSASEEDKKRIEKQIKELEEANFGIENCYAEIDAFERLDKEKESQLSKIQDFYKRRDKALLEGKIKPKKHSLEDAKTQDDQIIAIDEDAPMTAFDYGVKAREDGLTLNDYNEEFANYLKNLLDKKYPLVKDLESPMQLGTNFFSKTKDKKVLNQYHEKKLEAYNLVEEFKKGFESIKGEFAESEEKLRKEWEMTKDPSIKEKLDLLDIRKGTSPKIKEIIDYIESLYHYNWDTEYIDWDDVEEIEEHIQEAHNLLLDGKTEEALTHLEVASMIERRAGDDPTWGYARKKLESFLQGLENFSETQHDFAESDKPKPRRMLQTILVPNTIAVDFEDAKNKARREGRVHDPIETQHGWRFRQMDASLFNPDSFKTELRNGVRLIYADLLENPEKEEFGEDNEKDWFANVVKGLDPEKTALITDPKPEPKTKGMDKPEKPKMFLSSQERKNHDERIKKRQEQRERGLKKEAELSSKSSKGLESLSKGNATDWKITSDQDSIYAPKGLPEGIEVRGEQFFFIPEEKKWVSKNGQKSWSGRQVANYLLTQQGEPLGSKAIKSAGSKFIFEEEHMAEKKRMDRTTKDLLDAFVSEKDPKKEKEIFGKLRKSSGSKKFAESEEKLRKRWEIEGDPQAKRELDNLKERKSGTIGNSVWSEIEPYISSYLKNLKKIQGIKEISPPLLDYGYKTDKENMPDEYKELAEKKYKLQEDNKNILDFLDRKELPLSFKHAGGLMSGNEYLDIGIPSRHTFKRDTDIKAFKRFVIDNLNKKDNFSESRSESYESAPNYLESQAKLEQEIEDIKIEISALEHEIKNSLKSKDSEGTFHLSDQIEDLEKELELKEEELKSFNSGKMKFAEESLEYPEAIPDEVITNEDGNLVMYKFNTEENGYQIKAIISPEGESLPIEEDAEAIFSLDMLEDPQPVPGTKYIEEGEDQQDFGLLSIIESVSPANMYMKYVMGPMTDALGASPDSEWEKKTYPNEYDTFEESEELLRKKWELEGDPIAKEKLLNIRNRKYGGIEDLKEIQDKAREVLYNPSYFLDIVPDANTAKKKAKWQKSISDKIDEANTIRNKLGLEEIDKNQTPYSQIKGITRGIESLSKIQQFSSLDKFSEVSSHLKETALNAIPDNPNDKEAIKKNKTLFKYYLNEFIDEKKKKGLVPIQIDTELMKDVGFDLLENYDDEIKEVFSKRFPKGLKGDLINS